MRAGDAQQRLCIIEQAYQVGATASQHTAGAESFKHAALPQVVAQHGKEFAGAGFENFGEETLTNEARLLACACDALQVAADLNLGKRRNAGGRHNYRRAV